MEMKLKGTTGSRRRALHNTDPKNSKESKQIEEEEVRPAVLYKGPCQVGSCGLDAACKQFGNNTYTCVCPHDSNPPTSDLKCPTRKLVPITPHPIRNIIPPQEENATTTNHTTPRTAITAGNRSTLAESSTDVRILLGVAGIAVLAVLIISVICWWKRKVLGRCVDSKNSCSPSPLALKKSLLVAERYAPNPQYACTGTAVPLLRRETLKFMNDIGEGCFGKVFKGELQREDSEQVEIVAIKVLKESATREAEEDFLREVDIMSAFRHPNILSLLGVVLRELGLSPMMVFEFMPHGDLTEVLRGQWRREPNREDSPPSLTMQDLLSIAAQIAGGMKYLAAQRFVHRDLACRNCLVAHGPVVKIADFGMSRDVYTCDYYKIGGSRLLPVRWMSPESVMYGRFTLESDIWSYGVVLWEIFSYGKQPYYGHTNEEVVKLILQGIMLIPPDDCPALICDLMCSCWKTEPRDRIRFSDIFERLKKAEEQNSLLGPITRTLPLSSTVIRMKNERENKLTNKILPRPPPIPKVPLVGDLMDNEGYLLPQDKPTPFYLEALPD